MILSTIAGCHKRSFRWLVVILLVCLLPLPAAKAEADDLSTPASSPGGRRGVLRNPDFEEGFSAVRGGTVAEGWQPWWVEADDQQQSPSFSGQPGYEPAVRGQDGRGRVRSGTFAQKQATTYATHLGGVYQRVPVVPGSVVSFSMWVYVWSSSKDDPDRSQMPGNYRVSIGMDPKGGSWGNAEGVIWSRSLMAYDRWAKLTVSGVAGGEWVTVFTRGEAEWRVKHNDSYWDDASLQVIPPAGQLLSGVEGGEYSYRATGETDGWPTADGMVGVLQNPDFEEGFSVRDAVEVTVAEGWEPWWVKGTEEEQALGYLRRPEYKPEERSARGGEGRVHSGSLGQKQFTTFATHTAGIYQRVPVIRGSTVSFSIWVYVWSSSKDVFDRSKGAGDYKISAGLDPFGGTSGTASEVVWSTWVQQYDGWVKVRVQAVAQADQVTVFTRGQNGWRVRQYDSYWDDASLQVIPPAWQLLSGVEGGEYSCRATGETDGWPTADGMVGVLQNPDFEEDFSVRDAVEVTVAEGWEPWWVKGTEEEQALGYLRRPEYKPEERSARGGEGRVHSGSLGQKQFTTFATHTAGIYQRVPVVRGSTVSFSIWVYVWSSSKDVFDRSKGAGDYKISAGLDPFGGTSGTASEVVWSTWVQQYDGWAKVRVQAVAQADQVTVFTRGQNGWRVRHNDSYWDDASLQVILPIGETARPATGGSAPPIQSHEDEPAPPGEATGDPSPSYGIRADGLPGGEGHLVFQNERLSLEWWRASDKLSLEITVPSRLEGELALWVDENLVARWAILVVPSDRLTVAWQADGELVGSIGLQVSDADGQFVGEYGLIGERAVEY